MGRRKPPTSPKNLPITANKVVDHPDLQKFTKQQKASFQTAPVQVSKEKKESIIERLTLQPSNNPKAGKPSIKDTLYVKDSIGQTIKVKEIKAIASNLKDVTLA